MDKSLVLREIKNYYNFASDADFARFLEIKPQTLSNWYSRNTFDYDVLYTKCVDINIDWIFTGKGSMLKEGCAENPPVVQYADVVVERQSRHSEPNVLYSCTSHQEGVERQTIPFYEMDASLGLNVLFSSPNTQVPLDYITVPKAPKCDGALSVRGDSMYPVLKTGDIVCYKIITDVANIVYGEMYLIDVDNGDDQFLTVKYINKSDMGKGYVTLVSENRYHAAQDIPVSQIRALGIVKLSIRYNTTY